MKRACAILFALLATAALAAADAKNLSDPALEARARSLQKELRCLVCQGESLDESNAALAKELRRIIRERIAAGQSDNQIKEFLVARYGDFVLLRPPVRAETYALWLGPILILLLGGGAIALALRRASRRMRHPPR
ncbi:MAG: cytochrome c-type biogenesis protein [Alphaproteobacteria bacterium]